MYPSRHFNDNELIEENKQLKSEIDLIKQQQESNFQEINICV